MIAIVLFVLSLTVSCSNSEIESKNTAAANETENESEEKPVSSETGEDDQHNVFISELVPNGDRETVSINEGRYWGQLSLETTRISGDHVFNYNVERNRYETVLDIVNPITDAVKSSTSFFFRFYIVDNKIIVGCRGDKIAPNSDIPIFKTGDFYVSVYNFPKKLDNMIIYSTDLISWHQSGIIHPMVPILLYEKDDGLFALAGRQIWDVSDPRHARLAQGLRNSVMPPEPPITPWSPYVGYIEYVFNINNSLVMHTGIAAEERSGGEYFETINLDDFSRKAARVGDELKVPYNYKAVQR